MSDTFDPEQAATMLMQQHGENAAQYAAQWAAALLEAGNRRDARRFVQVAQAIRAMARLHPEPRTTRR
jgi:hypothetical protein